MNVNIIWINHLSHYLQYGESKHSHTLLLSSTLNYLILTETITELAHYDNIFHSTSRHIFHKSCVDPWLLDQRSCPMCKLDILREYGMQVHVSINMWKPHVALLMRYLLPCLKGGEIDTWNWHLSGIYLPKSITSGRFTSRLLSLSLAYMFVLEQRWCSG